MNNISDLIRAIGGPTKIGKLMDLPTSTVSSWQTFGVVKTRYWPQLIEIAKANGVENASPELLMNLCNAHAESHSDAA